METILQPPPPTTIKIPGTSYRIESIDFLRGLVMIIMALDHVRDFFHDKAMIEDPTNLATTTPILFFTRWITHFCAPVFVFLAGTSAFFQKARKSKKELSWFLISRGFWLIFIEIVVINFAFSFDPNYGLIGLQTIWSIGISMIILGLAVWLPFNVIVMIGLLIVLGHNSMDFYEADLAGNSQWFKVSPGWWYDFLHHPNFRRLDNNHSVLILYPVLPWTGLMMVGYGFGKFFKSYEGAERKKVLTMLGLGIILFFIVLRATNLYGDAQHWSKQKNALLTVLSFINAVKYPPSLLYMCMTIGPAILFIAWFGTIRNGLSKAITVYGRVPFFYYVLHFFWIHILCATLFLLRGHSFYEGVHQGGNGISINFVIPGEGYPLGIVYLIWLFVVVSLYPLCKWFSNYKRTHNEWWVSYL